jgi:light-regulated signal transduction histidine kinase (bacteriophytochrome)
MLEGGINDFVVENRYFRKDGRTVCVRKSMSLVRDQEGAPQWIIALVEDVTERKKAEEDLRRTARELERSNEDLQQFAYVASHDLQEPLRTISGFLKLLNDRYGSRMDDKAAEYIGYTVDASTRMSQLISDLLAYSRVDRKGRELEPTDAGAALDGALANLGGMIQEAGATVTHAPMPSVMGDSSQILQLFQNLIGNAVKFRSGERPCRVHLDARQRSTEWEFSVEDNGIGIAPDHFDRIFLMFQRLHSRDKYPGTGIGLSICKRIIERHGGRIWVESRPGQGSTFRFTLPGVGPQ